MQRSKLVVFSTLTVGLVAFGVSGCAGSTVPEQGIVDESENGAVESEAVETETADEENSATGSAAEGEATFTYGDVAYTSKLKNCSLTDGEDALFHGVAYDEAGNEVGYLDGDFQIDNGDVVGEARIDFGATEQFQSTEEFIALGDSVGYIVVTDFSDTSWYVMGTAWDQNGTETPSSSVKVSCE